MISFVSIATCVHPRLLRRAYSNAPISAIMPHAILGDYVFSYEGRRKKTRGESVSARMRSRKPCATCADRGTTPTTTLLYSVNGAVLLCTPLVTTPKG